jgi:hypothetical protein
LLVCYLKVIKIKIGKVAALNWFTLVWRRYFQYDPDFEKNNVYERKTYCGREMAMSIDGSCEWLLAH